MRNATRLFTQASKSLRNRFDAYAERESLRYQAQLDMQPKQTNEAKHSSSMLTFIAAAALIFLGGKESQPKPTPTKTLK